MLPGDRPQGGRWGQRGQKKGGGLFGWLFGKKDNAGGEQASSGGQRGGQGASGQGASGQGGSGRTERMIQALGLDAQQKAKADAIFAQARQQAGDDPDARRQAMRQAMGQLETILRPDQKQKLAQMRARMAGGGGWSGGGAGGGSGSGG
jgi:HlyD family secretion protein